MSATLPHSVPARSVPLPILLALFLLAPLALVSPPALRTRSVLAAEKAGAEKAGIEKGENALILEDNLEIEILSPTNARIRASRRIQVLTQRGAEENDTLTIDYNPWETIREVRGSILLPSGKRVDVKKQNMVDGAAFASYELYSDAMVRAVRFPGLVPGSIVESSYEKQIRNLFYLPRTFELQEWSPVKLKTLTVRTPASLPLRIAVRGTEPEYTREEHGGILTQTWRVHDVPALKTEPAIPPVRDVLPIISITPKSIVWDSQVIDSSTWNGIARWDWDLERDRVQPAAEVAQMARELTANVNEPEEKARRLFEFAQGKVNYVAVELGIGGYQPHSNGDVFKHRYGDCKDKAALLIAMLGSIGQRGFPVLINTRSAGLIDRDDPSPSFNHEIVAMPAENGYLFLDPTEEAPYGDLPWTDQGVSVLVIKGDGTGDLVETPLFPPERNRRLHTVAATLTLAGDLEGTYTLDAWGQRRVEMTSRLDAKQSEREDELADLIASLSPGALLKRHEVVPPVRPQDPVRVTIGFSVPHFVTRAGAVEIVSPFLVRFPGLATIAAYSGRRHPVFFRYLYSDTSEARLQLPPGRTPKKLPADRMLEVPGLQATTHFDLQREADHDVVVVRRSVTISKREIPVADYPKLRAFVQALAEEEAGAITLQAGG